ncbi:PAS domain-containing protein [Rhodospirillaceae bacterium KN72]|uniref:histidine kinase n=1 Tax=Pacificispira spongiicola TaxID=2729598 RepID=A0A7Y0E015_9PROT|nr:ATP-binding protein [Pacificispira spongiicola]NMM44743.1 PAS domain-containing protein [Pacificispira spongiicola]
MEDGSIGGDSTDTVSDVLNRVPYAFALFASDGTLFRGNRKFRNLLPEDNGAALEPFLTGVFHRTADTDLILAGICHTADLYHRDDRIFEAVYDIDASGTASLLLKDVTDRRQEARRIKDSEAKLLSLLDIASDWVWETDADLRLSYISRKFEHVMGVPAATFIGRRRDDYSAVSPDQAKHLRENIDMMERREPFRDFRFDIQDGSGKRRRIAISGAPSYDAAGVFVGYQGTGRDMTELATLSRELSLQAARISGLMKHSPAPIYFKDTHHRFIMANEAFCQERGTTVDELIGHSSAELFEPSVAHVLMEHDRAALESQDGVVREQNVNGRIVRSYKFPVFDEAGKLIGLGGVDLDVTDRVLEAQALATAKNDAERANRAKSFFLAKVSHELRTPLNAVIGFGEVLQNEVFGAHSIPRYKEYAADIVSSGRHLLGLVSDILDISKIESDELELKIEAIDLSALVTRAVGVVQAGRDQPHADITCTLGSTPIIVNGDSTALERIIFNLVGNAIKFTPPDGSIEVALRRGKKKEIILTVSDTGIGIPEDRIHDILEPFSTGASPLSLQYEGAGLGLAIVKALCDAHGAIFSIQSTVDVGTTCMVVFPKT